MNYWTLGSITLLLQCGQPGQQTEEETTLVDRYEGVLADLSSVAYDVRRVDTFPDGTVWDHTGQALLERQVDDTLYGFHFWGKRDDVSTESLYDVGTAFAIEPDEQTYRTLYAPAIEGSPGGQMVVRDLLVADTSFLTVREQWNASHDILVYTYPSDTLRQITNQEKYVYLSKENLLPSRVVLRTQRLGKPTVTDYHIKQLDTNEAVTDRIADHKRLMIDYEPLFDEQSDPEVNLDTPLPRLTLPGLLNDTDAQVLPTGRVTLIDFWEYWCSPCLRSFPKVEALYKKYGDRVDVIGISTQDADMARKTLTARDVTFPNARGNQLLLESLHIESFPYYLLADASGTIRYEYSGYSDEIERDIQSLLDE